MIKIIYRWLSMALVNNNSLKAFFEPLIQLFIPKWRANSYRAKVKSIRNENDQVYSLVLKASKRWGGFKPGQHVDITIEQNGSLVSRTFTISSAPSLYKKQRLIELTIGKQHKGRMTPWLCDSLKTGEYINLSAARGNFTVVNKNQPLLLIAGGTGITPFRSMIAGANPIQDIHLMYYAHELSHLFTKELSGYLRVNSNLKISLINSQESGHLCIGHLQKYCSDFIDRKIYICGPSNMIASTEQLLLENKVLADNIFHEYFGSAPIDKLDIATTGTIQFTQSIKAIRSTKEQPKTLLDMAELVGLKPITGCRMGICHQCICQKQTGVVYNTLTKIFSDTGAEEVQLCISVPVGDVSINL